MNQRLSIREKINEALETHGALTRDEISKITGLTNGQIGHAISYSLKRGRVRIENGRVVLSEGLFGPRVDASERGPGNMIFDLCKRNWRGYRFHQLLGSYRRVSV